ncbi:hypothetical protein SRHO_G00308650 [Serrasalmus rhombeus]
MIKPSMHPSSIHPLTCPLEGVSLLPQSVLLAVPSPPSCYLPHTCPHFLLHEMLPLFALDFVNPDHRKATSLRPVATDPTSAFCLSYHATWLPTFDPWTLCNGELPMSVTP